MKNINISYVYILKCRDNTLYTGWTNNILSRTKKHNRGQAAKYTRGRGPVKIVYLESFPSKVDAQKREYRIKQLNRAEKLNLIKNKDIKN